MHTFRLSECNHGRRRGGNARNFRCQSKRPVQRARRRRQTRRSQQRRCNRGDCLYFAARINFRVVAQQRAQAKRTLRGKTFARRQTFARHRRGQLRALFQNVGESCRRKLAGCRKHARGGADFFGNSPLMSRAARRGGAYGGDFVLRKRALHDAHAQLSAPQGSPGCGAF